nr:hypothetical protein CFP56_57670 [Quercus suber]
MSLATQLKSKARATYSLLPPASCSTERSLIKSIHHGGSLESEKATPNPGAMEVARSRRQPTVNRGKATTRQLVVNLSGSPAHMRTHGQRLRNNIRHRDGFQHSIAWTADLDWDQHVRDMRRDRFNYDAELHKTLVKEQRDRAFYEAVEMGLPARTPMNQPFKGKLFMTHDYPVRGLEGNWLCLYGSPVLNQKSIWSIGFEHNHRSRTSWPCAQELKYEGPDRISTDRIHRRLLPHPRISEDASVDWAQRPFLPLHVFDEVGYPFRHFFDGLDMLRWDSVERAEDEIFFATHWVADLEFTKAIDNDTPDSQGMHALGESLWSSLDMCGVWSLEVELDKSMEYADNRIQIIVWWLALGNQGVQVNGQSLTSG